MTLAGWSPIGYASKLLRTTKIDFRSEPTVSFGPEIVYKFWAESWAVSLALHKELSSEARRILIDKICGDCELRAAIKSAYALNGIWGIESLLKTEDGKWQTL
jgi:hypothetical protein